MNSAVILIIKTIFNLYTLVVVLRMMLHKSRADYNHPIVQAVIKLTDIFVKPLQGFCPVVKGVDTACLSLAVILQVAQIFAIVGLSGLIPPPLLALKWGVIRALVLILQVYFYAIILQAILSWVNPQSPISSIVYSITEPLLGRIRPYMPDLGGLDLTPIPVLIALQILQMLLMGLV